MNEEMKNEPLRQSDRPEQIRRRLSIADLFWLVFFFAALISFLLMRSPNGVSVDDWAVVIQLVIGGIMIVVFVGLPFCGALYSGMNWVIGWTLAWFALMFFISLGTYWFFLSLIVLSILVLVFAMFHRPLVANWLVGWRVFAVILAVSLLSGHVLQYLFPSYRVVQLIAGRTEFPIVDLTSRIPIPKNPSLVSSFSGELGNQFDLFDRLELEYDEPNSWRLSSLKRFHDESYERFIRNMGFGVARMIPASPERARLPKLADIPFDANEDFSFEDSKKFDFAYNNLKASPPNGFQNLKTHNESLLQYSYLNFLHPETFGYVVKRAHAAGFQPHAFVSGLPELKLDQGQFELQRLELISLLKFPEPRVYVLDHLPRMDQLSADNIETRDLNSFEQDSLRRFETGESLIVFQEPEQIRMVGALRAIKQCTNCHDAKRGDVLGAFSYEFTLKKRSEKRHP